MKILVIRSLIIIILFVKLCISQDDIDNENFKPTTESIILSEDKSKKYYFSTKDNVTEEDKIEDIISKYNFSLLKTKKLEKSSFDITTSFGNNIKFGGFWDKYAIINFTPQMFIKPVEFISIYANHNISCFLPITEIKKHVKLMALQSLTVLIVDNTIQNLIASKHWILDIVSFAVKNLVINLFIKSSLKKNNEGSVPMLEFKNYYYSLSIRF